MRRRGRGNNRKPSHHQHHQQHHQGRNPTFDSNGPGVRLRGTAHQIYEKYLMLGRDSTASGDRIMSENYLRHADHYYRIILTNQGPIENFGDRNDGGEPEIEAEGNGYGQGEQPAAAEGQQPQPGYGNTVPQTQGFNGGEPSQGTSLPGSNQPRGEGEGHQGGQGQQQHGFRRDRFNRRFRNRDDRGGDRGQNPDQGGERRDGDRQGGDRQGSDRRDQREGREHREPREGGHQRQQRQAEDEAFEPPAFLKAERPAGETPPRDPFNRDDEQR